MPHAAPDENAIRQKFADLIAGRCTREDADRWAGQWFYADNPPDMPAHRWEALSHLAGCDLRHGSRGDYLHSQAQFQEWLALFNRRCKRA